MGYFGPGVFSSERSIVQIFIANPTLQNRMFNYRVKGLPTPRFLWIGPGQQEQIPGDFDGDTLRDLIKQVENHGGIPAGDPRAIIQPKSLIYSVSQKPIKAEDIEEGMARDEEARQEIASQQMEKAGFAAYHVAQKLTGKAIETTMEVTEVTDGLGSSLQPVKDGVDMEVTVSAKPGKAGKLKYQTRKG